MNHTKILIVSDGFYPENSPRSHRATELAREFSRQGHLVKVITRNRGFDYSRLSVEWKLDIEQLASLRWPTLQSSRIRHLRTLKRIINRLLLILFEYPGIEIMFRVRNALRKENGYDLLITSAVPHPVHWGTASIRKDGHRIAQTWIADCGDPFMGCSTDTFKKLFYFSFIEKWWSRKADFITIPIENAKNAYYPDFHDKIKVIPQGFRFAEIKKVDKPMHNPVSTFAYAGSFIQNIRDPRTFLNYLITISGQFKFVVYTMQNELLIPYKEILKEKLEIRDYIPREELLKELEKMDFLINFDNNTSVQQPSKLIDYVLVNRPILNIKKNLNIHQIESFLNGDYTSKLEIDNLEQYNIINVAKQFLKLMNE